MTTIAVTYYTWNDRPGQTTIFLTVEGAIDHAYTRLARRPAGDYFIAYPLKDGGDPTWKGYHHDLVSRSLDTLIDMAKTLWGLDMVREEPPREAEQTHCCTTDTRSERMRRIALLYWQAADAASDNLMQRCARLYERHLKHRKVISQVSSILYPTHPDTWED